MSSDSKTASASPTTAQGSSSGDGEQPALRAMQPDEAASEHERPALEMTQCPACGARSFTSKLLVHEETSYDEDGTRTSRRLHVRAEFEFTCEECGTVLRTLPPDRRDYYEDVAVLAADRRAALRSQVQTLSRQLAWQLWAAKSWLALALTVFVAIVLVGL